MIGYMPTRSRDKADVQIKRTARPETARHTARKSTANLQTARKHASKRFLEVGLAMLQEAGVESWEFHEKGLAGRAFIKQRHVICPNPTTRRRLYVLAHECGHIALNHSKGKPSHRKEYEAGLYAHDALRRHGVAVPTKETMIAKQYVARRIDQAIRIGKAKRLDRESVKWCENEHRPATIKALASGSIVLVDLGGDQRKRRTSRSGSSAMKCDYPGRPVAS